MMRWDGNKVLVTCTKVEGRLEVCSAVDDAKWVMLRSLPECVRRWDSDSGLPAIETRALPTYSGLRKDNAELHL